MPSDDKPGHIIEIPESLGRDVDRYKAGNGPAPPMEAFMSPASLEQVEAQTAAASAPVHAGDLKPISHAEAGRRTTFDGEHLIKAPATRRVIPAPFRRPSIEISHHGRAWLPTRAEKVQAGDMVPDIGLVAAVEVVTLRESVGGVPDVAVGMRVKITGKSGTEQVFGYGQEIRAFRPAG